MKRALASTSDMSSLDAFSVSLEQFSDDESVHSPVQRPKRIRISAESSDEDGNSVCSHSSWIAGFVDWLSQDSVHCMDERITCSSPVLQMGQGVVDAVSVCPSNVVSVEGSRSVGNATMDTGGGLFLSDASVADEVNVDESSVCGIIGDDVSHADSPDFRLQGRVFHLTYRGHIPRELLFGVFRPPEQCEWWSCVHEFGKHQGESGDAYAHTHFFLRLKAKINKRGPRCCDINFNGEVVHPHIKFVRSKDHESQIFWEYHRKGPVVVDGVTCLWQSEKSPQNRTKSGTSALRSAIFKGSLLDCVEALGLEIRTVADANLIRTEKVFSAPSVSNFCLSDFTLQLNWMHFWPNIGVHEVCSIFIYGPSGVGKTEFAVAYFNEGEGRAPLLVRSLDKARDFHPDRYTGIVFDDANISRLSAEERIHLVDAQYEGSCACRYYNGVIPKGTKRIFTSNKSPEEFWRAGTFMTEEQFNAIKRRVKIIHVNAPLWR